MKRLATILVLGVLLGCASPAGASDSGGAVAQRAGALVIVGGALDSGNERVFRAMLDRRLEGRPICVVPLASAEPAESAGNAVRAFERWGGKGAAVGVDLSTKDPARARDAAFARGFRACGGVWFTGGDQSRIVDVLRPGGASTPAFDEILAVWKRGAVVGGTSAGAAIMSDPMIGGGDPAEALAHGVTADERGKGVWVRDGLGFLEGGLSDQHFLARSRLPRILAVLAEQSSFRYGAGVDEDTALVVDGTRAFIAGASSVAIVTRGAAEGHFSLWLLGEGDAIDLASLEVASALGKRALAPAEGMPRVPKRPFEDDALFELLIDIARAPEGIAPMRAETKGAVLVIARGNGFRALEASGGEPSSRPAALFAGPFELRIERAAAAGASE